MTDWTLLTSDRQGNMREQRGFSPLGATFGGIRSLEPLIPLPEGATLCLLPGRFAVGADRRGRQIVFDGHSSGEPAYAVGALLPTGHTRLQLPAFTVESGAAPLPLFGYTAVAARNGRIYTAACPLDDAMTWRTAFYHTPDLQARVDQMLVNNPTSAVLRQVAICARDYGCYTAQNIFYQRWEGALPASPRCAAQCVGCISEQLGDVPSPQQRLTIAPSPEDMSAVAVAHLTSSCRPMISFGQGCEGDPLNRARSVAKAIRLIRQQTNRGIINMNTNAWNTRGLDEIIDAGLQRIRVSIFSAEPAGYHAYYQPRGYTFANVERSTALAHQRGVYVALNLLAFPGYTDAANELDALCAFVERTGVDEIQVRTLNIDPDMLRNAVPAPQGPEVGIRRFLDIVHDRLPHVVLATHSRPPDDQVVAKDAALEDDVVSIGAP